MLVPGLSTPVFSGSSLQASSSLSSAAEEGYSDALSSLITAISSGTLSDAQEAMAKVQQYSPADTGTPVGSFLQSAADSLENNDIDGAQTALTTLRNNFSSDAGNTDVQTATVAESATATTFGENVLGLATAIDSQDTESAIASYNSLAALFTTRPTTNTGDDLSSDPGSDTDVIEQFKNVGTALNSGNISSAQIALDGFLSSLSAGSILQLKA